MSVLRNTTGQKWKCNKEEKNKQTFQTEIQHHKANAQQKAQFQVTNAATNATHGRTAIKANNISKLMQSFKADK